MRMCTALLGLVFLLGQQAAPVPPAQPSLGEWLAALRAEALTRGIGEATLDRALDGLEPVPVVIDRDRSQAELIQTLDQYLAQRLSKKVVQTAQTMRRTHLAVLKEVSAKYGVPPAGPVAHPGPESEFRRLNGGGPPVAPPATPADGPPG